MSAFKQRAGAALAVALFAAFAALPAAIRSARTSVS